MISYQAYHPYICLYIPGQSGKPTFVYICMFSDTYMHKPTPNPHTDAQARTQKDSIDVLFWKKKTLGTRNLFKQRESQRAERGEIRQSNQKEKGKKKMHQLFICLMLCQDMHNVQARELYKDALRFLFPLSRKIPCSTFPVTFHSSKIQNGRNIQFEGECFTMHIYMFFDVHLYLLKESFKAMWMQQDPACFLLQVHFFFLCYWSVVFCCSADVSKL